MLLAYFYYRSLGNAQLAAIGLISFAAIAQLAPAFFGGLFWRRGTARGAIGGLVAGFAVWAYTLFIPSFLNFHIGHSRLAHGPLGLEPLRPQALLGTDLPPLLHGVLWSIIAQHPGLCRAVAGRAPSRSSCCRPTCSSPTTLTPIAPNFRRWRTTVTVQDSRPRGAYLGPDRARDSFAAFAANHHTPLDPAAPADFELLRHAEHLIASSIGAAPRGW